MKSKCETCKNFCYTKFQFKNFNKFESDSNKGIKYVIYCKEIPNVFTDLYNGHFGGVNADERFIPMVVECNKYIIDNLNNNIELI